MRIATEIPDAKSRVYLDIEGVPADKSFYLIGMIVEGSDGQSVSQFWADSHEDEERMWRAFAEEVETLPGDLAVFHYGSYDRIFIEIMIQRYGVGRFERIQTLVEQLCDIHAAIRTNVFFPAYSNRLKAIAGSLGAKWSGPISTGIQSIVWRNEWESTLDGRYRTDLLRYNHKDCKALRTVERRLQFLVSGHPETPLHAKHTSDLHSNSVLRFGCPFFAIPEMRGIAKRAYFNYQQARVYIRSNRNVRRSIRRKKRRNRRLRENKRITCCPPDTCPSCGEGDIRLYQTKGSSKCITDLRFSESGVKRWVTEFTTQRWTCRKRHTTFLSPEYPKGGSHLGHGLASWVVNQQAANRQSHQALVDSLNDLFGLCLSYNIAARAMRDLAAEYKDTEQKLLDKLRHGHVIFADEAKVKVKGGTGYIWAFSGVEEVVYRFTETRSSTILEEILDGFEGVIVSDFYGGYDSTPCQQQKCLVHLIRDINNDLLKAPFNEELKAIAGQFTELLNAVVDDIDRFGLKKRHLNKFIKPASRFQRWVSTHEFSTKPAQRYQKRVRKYGDRLFTFLRHDGVSWNNNIAENAIKLVVSRRRFFGASYSHEGMRDYLLFLSFYQTLRRKGGSLLRFLLWKETDLLAFLGE
jgi:hypothetical protein